MRMVGMIAALALIWIGFHIYTWISQGEGLFLTPRNLWNLTVQTSSIAIMATAMVLVIVMRHIDLSVGSIVAFVSTIIGISQVWFLPTVLGLHHPAIWVITVVLALLVGAAIGGVHGWLVAYFGIPAFIVTLGGQLFWRGAAWWVTSGQTIAPLDDRFALIGGGPHGSIGGVASWALALIACVGIIYGLYARRKQRARYNFPQRPMWAEGLIGIIGCLVAVGATAVVNAYPWPERVAARYAEANNIPVPEGGLIIPTGYAIPVLIAVVIGLVMTFVAKRTKFGRYVYAAGGNPDAAELAGINTKRITVAVFALMGLLAGVAACIDSARLDSDCNGGDAKPGEGVLTMTITLEDGYKVDLGSLKRGGKKGGGEISFVRVGAGGKKDYAAGFKPTGRVTVVRAPMEQNAVGKLNLDLTSGDYMLSGDVDLQACVAPKGAAKGAAKKKK